MIASFLPKPESNQGGGGMGRYAHWTFNTNGVFFMLTRKVFSTTLMAVAFTMLLAGTAMAKEIVVMNGTGFEIHALALSPSESGNWGSDLLGDDILKPGEGLKINISGDANNWDLLAEDDDGGQVTFQNLDFRKASKITLHADGTGTLE